MATTLTTAQKKTVSNYDKTLGGWKTTLTKYLKSGTALTGALQEIETLRARLRGIIASSGSAPSAWTDPTGKLTHLWKMPDAASLTDSIGSLTLTAFGTPTNGTPGIAFNGSTQYYTVSATPIPVVTNSFSVYAWVKPTSNAATYTLWNFDIDNGGANNTTNFKMAATGQVFTAVNVSGSVTAEGSASPPDFSSGAEICVGMSWNGTAITGVYINGVAVDTTSTSTSQGSGNFIATRDGSAQFFDGTIRSLGVAGTSALTAGEHLALYNAGPADGGGGGGDVTAPTITSGTTANNTEGNTLSHTLTANESVTWSITGGADAADFEISGSTLRWASNGVQDYSAPADANTDNAYVVQITATDGSSNAANQTITITVLDDNGFDDVAELPRVTPSTTIPTIDGTTFTVTSGSASDLQTKINSARAADGNLNHAVDIPANVNYDRSSSLNIPAKSGSNPSGSGKLVLRTANHASLPAQGTRIIPGTDAANMPTIRFTANNTQLTIPINSHDIICVGLNVTATATTMQGAFINVGSDTEATLTNLPDNIVFDRCWVHGVAFTTTPSVPEMRRGFSLNCRSVAIVDSYISDIYGPAGVETNGINCTNGAGPWLIHNNHISAATENIIIGGGDPQITGMTTSDLTITNNHFTKNSSWFGNVCTVKNIFETKYGQRILLEGNVFENCGVEQQNGYPISFNNLTQEGTSTWTTTADVTLRYNVVRNVCGFLTIIGSQASEHGIIGVYTQTAARFSVHDNLVYDCVTFNGQTMGHVLQVIGTGESGEHLDGVTIKNNTIASSYTAGGSFLLMDVGTSTNLVFTDNVVPVHLYGIIGSGIGLGTSALNAFWPSSYTVTGNVWYGDLGGNAYPSGNFNPAAESNVGFDSIAGDDYDITGTYAGKGADMTALRAATHGVVTAGSDSIP